MMIEVPVGDAVPGTLQIWMEVFEMILNTAITEDKYPNLGQFSYILFCGILALLIFSGCRTISPSKEVQSETGKQQVFDLEYISSEQCITYLHKLGLEEVSKVPDTDAVLVTGFVEQLQRVSTVLSLIDTNENYVVHNLGPSSMVRSLPSNSQIAAVLGDINIGTFTNPPSVDSKAKGIIDIQGDSVITIIPARHQKQLLAFLRPIDGESLTRHPAPVTEEYDKPQLVEDTSEITADLKSVQPKIGILVEEQVSVKDSQTQIPENDYPHEGLGSKTPGPQPEPSFSDKDIVSLDSQNTFVFLLQVLEHQRHVEFAERFFITLVGLRHAWHQAARINPKLPEQLLLLRRRQALEHPDLLLGDAGLS